MPVIASGYARPVNMVSAIIKRNPGPSSLIIPFLLLCKVKRCEEFVDQPNPREWRNDTAQTVDQKISRQHLARANRLVTHSTEGQRDQGDDDHGVENYGRQHSALR